MKNRIPAFITVPAVLIFLGVVIAMFLDTEKYPAFWVNPYVWMFMFAVALLLLAISAINRALDFIKFQSLPDEEKAKYANSMEFSWSGLISSLTAAKAIEEEDEILLHHDYDGIQELDNDLPPWWVWLFYLTIFFGFSYIVRFYVLDGPNQAKEYEMEMAEAKIAVEEYLKNAPDLINLDNVEVLTDANSLAEGKKIYEANCVSCHTADGGGLIGPNLTDEYWILGGGIKNVFKTLTNGGRPGSGMIAWDKTLRPTQRQQVASYVLSLQGTKPASPKEPQGEIWKE